MSEKIPQLVNSEPLATEMLREVKANSRRWFIIAVIELIIILVISGLFFWYATSPVEESSVEIENEDGNASYIGNDMNGDFNYGEDQSYVQTQSSES